LSSRSIVRATEASLARLETDYVDFLTLDGLDPATPIDETLEAVDMLRRAGKARWLAVSGYPAATVKDINELAASAVYPPIRLVSTAYNLMQRKDYESDLAPLVKQLDIGVLARHPLASGYLMGDLHLLEDPPASPLFADAQKHVGKRGSRVLQALETVAGEHGKPVGRIALGWVLSKPGVVAAAIRINTAEQLFALISAGEVVLTRNQVAALDHASER
jgi:aryl-alcohol dehydrogenase-like predicted oxidoreductase